MNRWIRWTLKKDAPVGARILRTGTLCLVLSGITFLGWTCAKPPHVVNPLTQPLRPEVVHAAQNWSADPSRTVIDLRILGFPESTIERLFTEPIGTYSSDQWQHILTQSEELPLQNEYTTTPQAVYSLFSDPKRRAKAYATLLRMGYTPYEVDIITLGPMALWQEPSLWHRRAEWEMVREDHQKIALLGRLHYERINQPTFKREKSLQAVTWGEYELRRFALHYGDPVESLPLIFHSLDGLEIDALSRDAADTSQIVLDEPKEVTP